MLKQMKSALFTKLFEGKEEKLYVHVAPSKIVIDSIVRGGFYYDDIFQKTTDRLVNNEATFDYWLYQRRAYGDYAVVFGFSENLILQAAHHLETKGRKIEFQNLLSYTIPEEYAPIEGEDIHCLPPVYIKGWFKLSDFSWTPNPFYSPAAYPSALIPAWKTNLHLKAD